MARRNDNRLLPSLSRVTPSAASGRLSELIGYPISCPSPLACVHLELTLLPSTGITRLPRYYGPLRHPVAPFPPSRASGCRSRGTLWGFPCCVHFPCVHAVATTPVQQTGSNVAQTPPSISTFPVRVNGSACTSSFSSIAQPSLTLRPVRSHGHLCDRHPGASDISSSPCLPGRFRLEHRRVGLSPTRKCRLCTAHTLLGPLMQGSSSAARIGAFSFGERSYSWGWVQDVARRVQAQLAPFGGVPESFVPRNHPDPMRAMTGLVTQPRTVRMIYAFQSPAAIAASVESSAPRS